jgi:hypothetical protein
MNADDLEYRLQRQPLRAPPSAWRDQILAAARLELGREPVHKPTELALTHPPGTLSHRMGEGRGEGGFTGRETAWRQRCPAWFRHLRSWLWPHPIAWGALAACWASVFLLNWAAGVPPIISVRLVPGGTTAMALYADLGDLAGAAVSAKPSPSVNTSSPRGHPPTTRLIRPHETQIT